MASDITDALRDYECSLRPGEAKVFKAAYEKARETRDILSALDLGRRAVDVYRAKRALDNAKKV